MVQTNTDSDWEMRAQIKGWLILRKEANLPVNLSVYLDILAPLRHLSLGLQAKKTRHSTTGLLYSKVCWDHGEVTDRY